jgi:hypothetical protein
MPLATILTRRNTRRMRLASGAYTRPAIWNADMKSDARMTPRQQNLGAWAAQVRREIRPRRRLGMTPAFVIVKDESAFRAGLRVAFALRR